jgi:regulator of nucleoside diphosphate kinase
LAQSHGLSATIGGARRSEQMKEQSQGNKHDRLPEIIIGGSDHARLSNLATVALESVPDTAEELLSELDRATIVADESVPQDVVRMGSVVAFRSGNDVKRVTLVFPQDADIAAGKVSVLTPVGAALLGLATGGSITWTARDGSSHELTIVSVEQPEQQAA